MSTTAATSTVPSSAEAFIARWRGAAGENANRQPFLQELCDLLEVPRPDPRRDDDTGNAYCFEKHVIFHNGDGTTSSGNIDLYKRDCFVLEAKETGLAAPSLPTATHKGRTARRPAHGPTARRWDLAMEKARRQAEDYIKALPRTEPQPPFLVTVDVGRCFELYADFSRSGKTYTPFPDFPTHRIHLGDLTNPKVRERLRLVFTDPMSLDPTRVSARVTREIAGKLAELARELEVVHAPHAVAQFLMRCIFTMFAEDVELLKPRSFTSLLESLRGPAVAIFKHEMESLWSSMNTGGYASPIRDHVMRFNGGLFANPEALPLTDGQIGMLLDASRANWREVEPAIFGTLLERALDKDERAKLGAHYTPRAYVERLVMPTIIEPLRAEWETARANAAVLMHQGDTPGAAKLIRIFHTRLCKVRVLDPACGTGNFLYVSLDHMKRLEDEVLGVLHEYEGGLTQTEAPLTSAESVGPHQFLGIEINERAAPIAELVLWIGHLQWQVRTFGSGKLAEPVLHNYGNIQCRDALIEHDPPVPRVGLDGQPVTRWDGKKFKTHPVTGEQVPDETARTVVMDYRNARKARWPEAEFIIGNPPFLGPARMRDALGDGYAEAVRRTYPEVPESVDFVMYWWHKAAGSLKNGSGFQPLNQRQDASATTKRASALKSGSGFQPLGQRQDASATIIKRQGAYLPHWTKEGALYSVTFRLDDSLPESVVAAWKAERDTLLYASENAQRPLNAEEERRLQKLFSEKVERYLDAGTGSCWMNKPDVAKLVADALKFFDGERYLLHAWSVMPNHVHVVVEPLAGFNLDSILHSWKSFTSNQANKLLGRNGTFWQKESYDHLIRDEEDYDHCVAYALNNPADAGLTNWPWVSKSGSGFQPLNQRQDASATVDASATESIRLQTFGFITTNSLRQTFNRRVLQYHMKETLHRGSGFQPLNHRQDASATKSGSGFQPLNQRQDASATMDASAPSISLKFAIPDHPWVDTADGAAVRIAMSVAQHGTAPGTLQTITREDWPKTAGSAGTLPAVTDTPNITFQTQRGIIQPDLTVGAAVARAKTLEANLKLSSPGVKLHGAGFIVSPVEAQALGLGRSQNLEEHIRPYFNGRDLTQKPRGAMVIDLFGLSAEEARSQFPEVYQHVYQRVKPERDTNNRATYRDAWWIFGEPRRDFRPALAGLPRYIATVETSKHRFFVFLDASILPDNMLVCVALHDAYYLGVLSSRLHVTWALAAGGRLGMGNDPRYNKSRCFDPFPFPAATPAQTARIRELGERLDAHRKRQQALHPSLTLTDLYNVVEKLRSGEPLTTKERATHEAGLATVLLQIHDELDAAVADAYGWPATLGDQEILANLVALNAERAEEERNGLIRYLRPDYQRGSGFQPLDQRQDASATLTQQNDILGDESPILNSEVGILNADKGRRKKSAARETQIRLAWPNTLAEQAQAVRTALASTTAPATPKEIAGKFTRAQSARVHQLLETLASLGQARQVDHHKFIATFQGS